MAYYVVEHQLSSSDIGIWSFMLSLHINIYISCFTIFPALKLSGNLIIYQGSSYNINNASLDPVEVGGGGSS